MEEGSGAPLVVPIGIVEVTAAIFEVRVVVIVRVVKLVLAVGGLPVLHLLLILKNRVPHYAPGTYAKRGREM